MNKKEKRLAKKLIAFYNSPINNSQKFSNEENIILERWRVIRIINEDAFGNITSHSSNHKEYLQNRNYPFTSHGDDEVKKNWYLKFRNSNPVIVVRDILTVFAFLVSLYLAIMEGFSKNVQ